jgi:tetratricopeptide (TPR) repeat protein
VAAILMSLGALCRTARADDTAAAREHYQKGTAYYDLGRYQDAIKEFEAAYEIKSDPALLYNLAQSHRLAGNPEQALHFYRTYLRRVPKAPNKAEIEGRIAALEQQIAQKGGNQTLPPPLGGGTGTTTTGTGAQPPPPPPPDPAGTQGTGTTTTTTATTTVSPPPLPPRDTAAAGTVVTAPAPPLATDAGRTKRLAGIGVAGAGGLLVVIGLVEGLRAAAAANEINDAAKMGKAFDPAVEDRGKRAQRWEAGLLVVGALAGAGGGALYYMGRKDRERSAAISVTPIAVAGQVGALLRVAF